MTDDLRAPAATEWAGLSVQERYRSSVGGSFERRQASTMGPYRLRLIITDITMITIAMAVGLLVSSRQSAWLIDPFLAIYGTPVVIGLLWMAMLFLRGSYDQRIIGLGTDEFRRIFSATLYTFAIVAGTSYLIRADISRAYAYVSLPLGVLLIALSRFAWRKWLYKKRYEGRFLTKTVVIAGAATADALIRKLVDDAYVGFRVVGRVDLPPSNESGLHEWLNHVDVALDDGGASAVAIDPGDAAHPDAVRQLAWRLEGRGIDLLISPGMLDVAGPRLSVRPISGLPLLHLDEVALTRPQRLAKRALDLLGASLCLLVLSPVMVACASAVKVTSPGPIVFRQVRIGRSGKTFTMLKFRSMRMDSDAEREVLRRIHLHDAPMFKLENDPRVTSVGKVLRRWSLDELPQLFNVMGGSMSLVGPRPHPVDDVSRYEVNAYRRLALKPGMTGLWQVEGRSSRDWSEALQLDLYYVERWSLSGDILILTRTLGAVMQGKGAN